MLTRKTSSSSSSSSSCSSAQHRVFTHVFGMNRSHKILIAGCDAHARMQHLNALDEHLYSHSLIQSRWWTRFQARVFFQHDLPALAAATSVSSLQEPPSFVEQNALLRLPKSGNFSSDHHAQNLSYMSQRWPRFTYSGVKVPVMIKKNNHNSDMIVPQLWCNAIQEEAQRASLLETASLMTAVRSAMGSTCHALHPVFLVFSTKDGIWRAVPQSLIHDLSLRLSAPAASPLPVSALFPSSLFEQQQQFFFDTMSLQQQLVRSALHKELRAEEASSKMLQEAASETVHTNNDNNNNDDGREQVASSRGASPVAAALSRAGAGRLNFVLLSTDQSIEHSSDNTLFTFNSDGAGAEPESSCNPNNLQKTDVVVTVTLYPEEHLLPLPNFVSSLMRDPGTPHFTRAPFLIQPRSVVPNDLFAAAAEQQPQQLHQNHKARSGAGTAAPIPIPSSIVASLIAHSTGRRFASPLWLQANSERFEVKDIHKEDADGAAALPSTTAAAAEPPFLFDWLKPDVLMERLRVRQQQKQQEQKRDKISEPSAQPVISKLTPPPVAQAAMFKTSSTCTATDENNSNKDNTSNHQSAPQPHQAFAETSLASRYDVCERVVEEVLRDLSFDDAATSETQDQSDRQRAALCSILTRRIREVEQFVSPDVSRVMQASEESAISLLDVPELLKRSVQSLRSLPPWLKKDASQIIERERNEAHARLNNNSNSASSTAKKSIKKKSEIFVLGLFGVEAVKNSFMSSSRSVWRRVRHAQVPARVLSAPNHNKHHHQGDDDKSVEALFFVTVPFLRHIATHLDFDRLAHVVDHRNLDSESLDSYLHKQRCTLAANAEQYKEKKESGDDISNDGSNEGDADRETDVGSVFSAPTARGLGPMRAALEKQLAKLQNEQRLHVARFSRWNRQSAYINADQLQLFLESKKPTTQNPHHETPLLAQEKHEEKSEELTQDCDTVT